MSITQMQFIAIWLLDEPLNAFSHTSVLNIEISFFPILTFADIYRIPTEITTKPDIVKNVCINKEFEIRSANQ